MRDLLFSLRELRNAPGFALAAILSLGLGIGLNAALFTLTNALFLRPLPVAEPQRLARISTVDTLTRVTGPANPTTPVSLANLRDLQAQQQSFSALAADVGFTTTLSGADDATPRTINTSLVSANYFEVLGIQPALGQFLPGVDDAAMGAHPQCVLSHALWASAFHADASLVGRKITLSSAPYVVTGIAPPGFKGASAVGEPERIWVPLTQYRDILQGLVATLFETRRFRLFNLTGRLRPGVSLARANAEMTAIGARLAREYPVDNKGRTLTAEPLTNAVLPVPPDRLWLVNAALTGAASLVLLIACVNVANLLLIRSVGRAREFGLRAAMGASRARLVRQLLTESLLLSAAGCALGLLLAIWGRNLLWAFRPAWLSANSVDLSFDYRVLLFASGLSVLTAMLFSLAPAWRAATPDLNGLLRTGGSRGASAAAGRLRGVLVAAEVAFCFIALAGAGLFLRSMQRVQRIDPGLDTEHTFSIGFHLATLRQPEPAMLQLAGQILEKARAVPGIESAALSTSRPLGGFTLMGTFFREGQTGDLGERPFLAVLDSLSGDFFATTRTPLLQGRALNEFDRANTAPVAVVNEAFARELWPNESALGKRFFRLRDPVLREVVGIVRNTARQTPGEVPRPSVYLPLEQFYQPGLALVGRTRQDPAAAMANVMRVLQPLAPALALADPTSTSDALASGLWAPRMGAALFGLFGALGLALAVIGVHGVVSYTAAERTREMGIRLALGSAPAAVARMVISQGLWPIAAGLMVGLLATALLGPRFADLLFETPTADPVVFGGMALVLVLAGVVAAAIPAWRAARLDPVAALREE